MEQETMQRFKRTQVILLLAAVILLFFGGCGQQENSLTDNGQEPKILSAVEGMEDTAEMAKTSDTADTEGREQTDSSDAVKEALTLPLSDEKATVEYAGDLFMSSYRAMGADSIYLTGYYEEPTGTPANSDYFVGRLEIEDSEIREFSLDLPKDMFVLRACVDVRGRCHLLFTQKEDNKVTYENMKILVVNQKGETEQRIDLSEYPEYEKMKTLWYWMVADGRGNYYLGNPAKLLTLDTDTGKVWLYQPEDESVEGLGIGKSGTVYGVFEDENREAYLGEIHTAEDTVVRCVELPESSSRVSFSIVQPGVSTELLLADKGAGIWRYDGQEITLAIPMKDIMVSGQDILGMGFLADGRCCIMSYEDDNYRFYYVPVELETD